MKITFNVKLGIVAGILNCIAWFAFSKSLGYYSLAVEQYRYYVTLFLLFAGIFLSIFLERKNNEGYIDFKDAVKTGILFAIILGLILAIFNYLYYKFMAIDAIDYFIGDARKLMEAEKLKEDEILKYLDTLKSYFGSFRMFMSTVIMGVIISLLFGAILRKKKVGSELEN